VADQACRALVDGVGAPDERPRVQRHRVDDGEADKPKATRPGDPAALADERHERAGRRDGVKDRLAADRVAGGVDIEAERFGEVMKVRLPLAAGDDAGHPGTVAG
jgi:hypothetical protein